MHLYNNMLGVVEEVLHVQDKSTWFFFFLRHHLEITKLVDWVLKTDNFHCSPGFVHPVQDVALHQCLT